MYFTYILESLKDRKFYTGYTSNLRERFKEHNDGLANSTKSRRPFRLIYYEAYLNSWDAKRRERYFKTGMGKRDIKKRLKDYFQEKEKV